MAEKKEPKKTTRREMLGHTARGAVLLGLGGTAAYLAQRASAADVWQIDTLKCVNSALGRHEEDYDGIALLPAGR